jgi:hypothetical protein
LPTRSVWLSRWHRHRAARDQSLLASDILNFVAGIDLKIYAENQET